MTRTSLVFLAIVFCLASTNISAQSELQIVNIGDFSTTGGDIIKDCKIGYRTSGKINNDSSNIILFPTWFDGTSENILKPYNLPNWMDSTGFFIIVVDALGDGISSSPSNSFDFPEITIRDMVNSQHELLVKHLNINSVYAVFGISMGGMQAFEWMVAYPEFVIKAISICGTPKQTSYDLFVWQTQADMIYEATRNQNDMDITMKRVYDICYMNCYTPSFFTRSVDPDKMNQWRNYRHMMDAGDYLAQLNAMITHDIYKSASILQEQISDVIESDALIIVSLQDHLVNPSTSIEFAKQVNCKHVELTGDCGHTAIWCEAEKIKEATIAFLQE